MPSPVVELLAALDSGLQSLGIRWYLFGAQAAIVHGAARLTADVDATIDAGEHSTAELANALSRYGFEPRVEDIEEFVARTRVFPAIHRTTQMGVDLVLAGTGIEELFLQRSERRTIEGIQIPVASPEDIVAMKILAGRSKDLDDVSAIAAAQGNALDLTLIRNTLRDLEAALDRSDLVPALERVLARGDGSE
jgi:Nucleotidyl transferase AbiEii toxin, Type IV TA system